MSKIQMELSAEMEDGTTEQVVADQRDIARWEIQPFGCPFAEMQGGNRALLAMRWLAWHALHRMGRTTLGWDAWDGQCVEVMPPDDEGTEDAPPAEEVDPGRPARSASASSRSRGARVKR